MVKPLHSCWWSHEKQTQLRFHEGHFTSSGTSLSVLWDALNETDQQWFSREYGEVHGGQAENVFLIAPVKELSVPTQPGALATRLGDTAIRESFLSDSICQALNLSKEEEDFAPNDLTLVDCAIRLHDDCFAKVQTVDKVRLMRLVHSTLKMHSYYQGKDVEWLPVIEPLTEILETVEELELISDAKSGTIWVDHPHQSFARRLGKSVKPYFARIDITHGQASLELLKNIVSSPH